MLLALSTRGDVSFSRADAVPGTALATAAGSSTIETPTRRESRADCQTCNLDDLVSDRRQVRQVIR
jgi:hypothetical protein